MARLSEAGEAEVAEYVSLQLGEILPLFVDGISEGTEGKVYAVREFREKMGKVVARAIVMALGKLET